jgi:hypothetical protein
VTLISPTGEILYAADDIESGIITDSYVEITLPTTGMYQIEVRSWNDESGGAYTLEIGSTPFTLTPTATSFAG